MNLKQNVFDLNEFSVAENKPVLCAGAGKMEERKHSA